MLGERVSVAVLFLQDGPARPTAIVVRGKARRINFCRRENIGSCKKVMYKAVLDDGIQVSLLWDTELSEWYVNYA